jgi:hypothetical protein
MTGDSLISLRERIRSDIEELAAFILGLDLFGQVLDGNTIHFDVFASLQRTAKTCKASQVLSRTHLYASSLASCRTATEQMTSNFLNLRAEGVYYFVPFATFEDAVEWIQQTKKTISSESDFSFVGAPQRCPVRDKLPCVPVIMRNVLSVDSGTRKVPFPGVRLLSVIDQHRHDHSAKGDFFRGHAFPYVGDKNARLDQKHRYHHHFRWRALLDAMKAHELFAQEFIERLDRHYSYLSLFAHGTPNTDNYLSTNRTERHFESQCLELMIDLYCYCILFQEIKSLEIYERTTGGIATGARTLMESHHERFQGRVDALGFVDAQPHKYDKFQDSSYRSGLKFASGDPGFLREDSRPHLDVDVLRRITSVFRPTFSLENSTSYEPPTVP